MHLRDFASRSLVRLAICLAIGSSVTWLGCSSEVGTVPSAKKASSEYLAKEAEKEAAKKAGPAPKSIKGKLFNPEAPK
jgi:hypothetical protein